MQSLLADGGLMQGEQSATYTGDWKEGLPESLPLDPSNPNSVRINLRAFVACTVTTSIVVSALIFIGLYVTLEEGDTMMQLL